jgi:hypothetical protein
MNREDLKDIKELLRDLITATMLSSADFNSSDSIQYMYLLKKYYTLKAKETFCKNEKTK